MIFIFLILAALPVIEYSLPANQRLQENIDRSGASLRAIMAGLERYHDRYGEYPVPAKPDYIFLVDGQSHNVSSALMLYQAMSADGHDHVALRNATTAGISDGQVDHSELSNATLFDIPKELWRKTDAGFILVDGFGHPFQYTPPGPETVNQNYDLWSFGGTSPPAIKIDKATKQSPASDRWIKNW